MKKNKTKKSKGILTTPEIMEALSDVFLHEMAGIIRYLHYSFMIMGHNRIPIQKWFRDQASESMTHATAIGEKITAYGGHPPVVSAPVDESHVHSISAILEESLTFEEQALEGYRLLSQLAAQEDDIALEEMARDFVRLETEHIEEVRKMLRAPK